MICFTVSYSKVFTRIEEIAKNSLFFIFLIFILFSPFCMYIYTYRRERANEAYIDILYMNVFIPYMMKKNSVCLSL